MVMRNWLVSERDGLKKVVAIDPNISDGGSLTSCADRDGGALAGFNPRSRLGASGAAG